MLPAQNQKSQDLTRNHCCNCQLLRSYKYIDAKIVLNTSHTYIQVKYVSNTLAILKKQSDHLSILIQEQIQGLVNYICLSACNRQFSY